MDRISDHQARAVELLSSQDKGVTIPALVTALASEIQVTEDEVCKLVADRMLTTAVGIHLDNYGRLVGVLRDGLADVDFAKILVARIATNLCCGNPEQITAILSALSGSPVQYRWDGVAAYRLEWTDARLVAPVSAVDLAWKRAIMKLMDDARPAGVGVTEVVDSEDGFLFDTVDRGFDAGEMGEVLR